MKLTNKQKLYLNAIALFFFTYFLASKVISGFKTQDFDFTRIVINTILLVFCIMNVIKYANIENNSK